MSDGRKNSRYKKRSGNKGYKILTVAVFTFLSIYLLGYLIAFISKPSISIETVSYGTINAPASLRGIIVREEMVVKSQIDGQPSYNYAENSRVAKNALVCTVKNGGAAALIEEEIKKIDKSIIEIQKKRKDFSIFREDIERVQKNIENIVDESIYKFGNSNISDMYSVKSRIEDQVKLRNQIWLAENSGSISNLAEEKLSYETRLSENKSYVKAEKSGLVSLKTDGFEDIVTYETVNDIAQEQIKMKVQPQYISKNMSVTAGSPLFKLVTSNTWRIVTYIPNETASKWKKGDYLNLYVNVEDEVKSVSVEIESMEERDSLTYTVFVTDKNIIDFLDFRTIDFKAEENIYEGFKIPNEAIVEKTFIKIPKDCVSSSLDDMAVIKRKADGDELIKIKVFKSDEENLYILQDFKELKIGDTIIPPGENSQAYILNQVETYKGVYVANSSVAEFTVVDILGSNSEYSVVSAQSRYGLKIYDKIVSDARAVESEENIN